MPLDIAGSFSFLFVLIFFLTFLVGFIIFFDCFYHFFLIFLSLFVIFYIWVAYGGRGPKCIGCSDTCPCPAVAPIRAPNNNRFCTGMSGDCIDVSLSLPGISLSWP